MKKLNLICAAIAIVASGVASAGTLTSATTGGTRFAQEIFGGTTDDTTTVTPDAVTYSVATTNGIVVNASGTLYLTLKLTNGKFSAAPAASTISGTMIGTTPSTNLGGTVGAGTLSSDKTTVVYPITFPSTGTTTIGVGATLVYTAAATDINSVKGALGVAGGTVSLTAGLSSLAASATPGATVPADVDGPNAVTAPIAQSVNGITTAVSVDSTLTSKIDVSATSPNTQYTGGNSATTGGFTSTAVAPLGRVKVTVPSTAARTATNTALTLAAYTATGAKIDITVTPNAGSSFPSYTGTTVPAAPIARVFAVAGTDCTGTAVATSAALTGTAATSAVTLTIPQASFAAGQDFTVCQGTANGGAISPITPTITAVSTPATALTNYTTDTSGATTGYALTYNGAVVTTVGYWPAALSQFGYTTFTRVINTGTSATSIQAALVNQTTGSVGTAVTLPLPTGYGTTLAPGASVTWTNAAVESVLGAVARDDRPTLRISGQTSSLKVQQFVQSPNGTFNEVSGSQQ